MDKKKPVGRPPKPDKKKSIHVKLPPKTIKWMDEQPESRAVLIEEGIEKIQKGEVQVEREMFVVVMPYMAEYMYFVSEHEWEFEYKEARLFARQDQAELMITRLQDRCSTTPLDADVDPAQLKVISIVCTVEQGTLISIEGE